MTGNDYADCHHRWPYDQVTPVLHSLHWLKSPKPVDHLYKCLHSLARQYVVYSIKHCGTSKTCTTLFTRLVTALSSPGFETSMVPQHLLLDNPVLTLNWWRGASAAPSPPVFYTRSMKGVEQLKMEACRRRYNQAKYSATNENMKAQEEER